MTRPRTLVTATPAAALVAVLIGLLALTATPARGQGIVLPPGNGTITSGEIPKDGGFGLIVFGGGSFAQLVVAAGCPGDQVAFWTASSGRFIPFIPRAEVQAANADFAALYPNDTIPTNTPLIGRCLPVPGPRVVTLDDNGATVQLRVGDTIDLRLGGNYNWLVDIADPTIIDREAVIAIYPPPPRTEGVYAAFRPGATTITAIGTPKCHPACLLPSAMFSITLVVR